MQEFKILWALDMAGVIHPLVPGKPAEMKVGLSPGFTGHRYPNGSVEFHLPKGRTLTVAAPPAHLDRHII